MLQKSENESVRTSARSTLHRGQNEGGASNVISWPDIGCLIEIFFACRHKVLHSRPTLSSAIFLKSKLAQVGDASRMTWSVNPPLADQGGVKTVYKKDTQNRGHSRCASPHQP